MTDMWGSDKFELIAILRGVKPAEVVSIANRLAAEGINRIEVPLNSPHPLASIQKLADTFSGQIRLGAGTVLTPSQVDDVSNAGASFVLTPNCNPDVIAQCIRRDITCIAGFTTPTEALTALQAGAQALKFFPAQPLGVNYLTAVQAVLPGNPDVFAVGGIGLEHIDSWMQAGVKGVGLGSSLYAPGIDLDELTQRCKAYTAKVAGFKHVAH